MKVCITNYQIPANVRSNNDIARASLEKDNLKTKKSIAIQAK